jgi:hypothetical protein
MARRKKTRPQKAPAKRAPSRPRSIPPRRPSTRVKPCPARDEHGKRCLLKAGHSGKHAFPTPSYRETPARWYSSLINKERAWTDEAETEPEIAEVQLEVAQLERKRLLETDYLKESIKLLRKFVKGFETSDGYDLNKLAFIPDARLKKVRDYAPLIREEIAQPHIVVSPRGPSAKRALEKHTGQRTIPGRKRYIVFTPTPNETRARLIRSQRVAKDSRGRKRTVIEHTVELSKTVKGGKITDRFFYLPEPPESFEDIIAQTRKMLRFMPKGWYTLVTSTHGNIAIPIRKDQILQQLHDRYLVYDKIPKPGLKINREMLKL